MSAIEVECATNSSTVDILLLFTGFAAAATTTATAYAVWPFDIVAKPLVTLSCSAWLRSRVTVAHPHRTLPAVPLPEGNENLGKESNTSKRLEE